MPRVRHRSEAVDVDRGQLGGRRLNDRPIVVRLHEFAPVGGRAASGRHQLGPRNPGRVVRAGLMPFVNGVTAQSSRSISSRKNLVRIAPETRHAWPPWGNPGRGRVPRRTSTIPGKGPVHSLERRRFN